ncbi:MAG: hypothetical protein AAF335_04820, partial [Bacteroidota bacterium]
PYFPGYKIEQPPIIICSGNIPIENLTNLKNEQLKKALKDRILQIYVSPPEWDAKRELIKKKMDRYCIDYNISFDDLSDKEKKEIQGLLDEMERESTTSEGKKKYDDFRQVEKQVKEYLEDRQMREFYKKREKKNRSPEPDAHRLPNQQENSKNKAS